MAWALPRAANQFWMLSEPTQAIAFLQTIRNRVSAPAACATLDALAATFAMNAGTPLRALRLAEEVLASPDADDVAIGWAASAAALSSAGSAGSAGSTSSPRGRCPPSIRACCGSPAASAGSPRCSGGPAGRGAGARAALHRVRRAAAARPRDRRGARVLRSDRTG